MGASARVCLIDDDPLVRDAMALGLGDWGYEVSVAADGASGLGVIAQARPDIVVTDMNMPGVGGAQLIPAIRARWAGLPVIAISGGGQAAGRAMADLAREVGADAVLTKPFRIKELVSLIDQLATPAPKADPSPG